MAVYTPIPDSKIDADSPATEELFTFLRDNIDVVRAITKISKTFADFSAAATSKTITLVNLQASSEMIHVYANITTAFTGAGNERLQIGDDDTPEVDSFLESKVITSIVFVGTFEVAARGSRLDGGAASPPVISFSSAFNVTATVRGTINLDNLTAGVVDFYIIHRVLDV